MNEKVSTARVCFIANFYKTFLFHELSKKLNSSGITVFWIVTKSEQYDYLKSHYNPEHILYINRAHSNVINPAVDDFKLNELVFGDRVLRHEVQHGLDFLTNIQLPIYNFIKENKINFIFGEITWAHEVLILRMSKKRSELRCKYFECSAVRMPNNRFAFFRDEEQYEIAEFDGPSNLTEAIKIDKPAYLKINDKLVKSSMSLKSRLSRLKRFLTGENIEKNDPNVIINSATRFKIVAREEFNKSAYRYVKRTKFEEIENEKFVFYGFHKQPESSIDVNGRYYDDQALNIINLWRVLPGGWKLVIKEHTNAIGDRSYGFYKKLLKYPGIVLVEETTDSRKLIEKSKLVATVTGTIAYEAALLKKPSITFVKMFFNRINYCKCVPITDLITCESIESLVGELNSVEDNRLEFSNFLMKNSFDGNITDPHTDPSVLEEENLKQVCDAFIKLIDRYN